MKNESTLYNFTTYAIFTALLCIFAPMSIPIGPVPISLTNFVLYVAVFIIGLKGSLISYGIYLLLGIVGLPIFSGYEGGPGKLVGPTGGYLIGFFLIILISGIVVKFQKANPLFSIPAMIIGTALAYVLGTIWFVIQAKCSVEYALTLCVYPFIIVDLIKIVIGCSLGNAIRIPLIKAGFIEVAK